jgi:ABC-type bacteriocin/lantibiotic exporter with double-glycine peptidase domain
VDPVGDTLQSTASLSTSLAARLAWRMLRLPMRYFNQRSAGEIAWRLDLPDAMSRQASGPLPAALVSSVSVVILHRDAAGLRAGCAHRPAIAC